MGHISRIILFFFEFVFVCQLYNPVQEKLSVQSIIQLCNVNEIIIDIVIIIIILYSLLSANR